MIILLPPTSYYALLRSTRLGTPAYNSLYNAAPHSRYAVARDLAVLCDTPAAQDMLQAANADCPEAVPIIEEGLRAIRKWESRG